MIEWRISRAFIERIEEENFLRACSQDSRYYRNKEGQQIKIDVQKNMITLLDKNGFTLVKDEMITEEDFVDFLNDRLER